MDRDTPGTSVDYDFVAAALIEDAGRFDITMTGIDAWNCLHMTNTLAREGFPVETVFKVGQGYKSLSEPSKAYEDMVFAGLLDHAARLLGARRREHGGLRARVGEVVASVGEEAGDGGQVVLLVVGGQVLSLAPLHQALIVACTSSISATITVSK